MLQQLESVKSRWGGKSQVVDRWLMDRQALLVSFCELAGINKQSESLPDADEIANFCSALLDYLSAGHFEVFDILVEDDDEGLDLKDKLYPKLTKTTDAALAITCSCFGKPVRTRSMGGQQRWRGTRSG